MFRKLREQQFKKDASISMCMERVGQLDREQRNIRRHIESLMGPFLYLKLFNKKGRLKKF